MAATFPMIIAFAFMAAMLLIGTWLRANVPIFRTALIPASLIGGVVGFILISAGLSLGFEARTFAPFTFHFFTLSFMSLVLTGSSAAAKKSSPIYRGGMWLTLFWTMSLAMQALIGFGVIA
ncbi:MAG: sodium:glutamate symporter, partial [Rhodospirillaceae bacterium]|nr:sodium:glutamate symporter [Rhodospirillaceae bacterium]